MAETLREHGEVTNLTAGSSVLYMDMDMDGLVLVKRGSPIDPADC